MMNMSVQNFRALIIVPSPAQYRNGSIGIGLDAHLLVPAYYFELGPPPLELQDPMLASEFMVWTAPFETPAGTWKYGHLTFQHQGSLRVKMAWPQFANRVDVVHFDSVLTVSLVLLCLAYIVAFLSFLNNYITRWHEQ